MKKLKKLRDKIQAIADELNGMMEDGISDEELAEAVESAANSLGEAVDSLDNVLPEEAKE